jgi:peptidoglycan/LPS O-acetylase OafA/YrhL
MGNSTPGPANNRRHDLDALRAAAMLLGIALHASLSFVKLPWVVQDSREHDLFGLFGLFVAAVHGFRMPLFFLLSGFFTAMLWRRRGLKSLLGQRVRRIVLPLALCMVTVVPIMTVVNGIAMASGIKRATVREQRGEAQADIWAAARSGAVDAIREHLAAGVDVDGQHPESGATALTVAAMFDQSEAVDLLLRRGADVNARGREKGTALHAAAFLGHAGPARLLVEAGADLDARNGSGATPEEVLATDWATTQFIAELLLIRVEEDKVMAGRKEVAALLAEGDSGARVPGRPARAPGRELKGARSGRIQRLMETPVFHHLWFLWFLCWLVPGFAICAIVAGRLGWQGAPAWLVVSPARFLWLIPLTMVPQWFMGQASGAFGPDTSAGLLPMPRVLLYYAIFFGFGALYYDADDSEGRVGRWWWLALPAALAVALPLGLALSMGAVDSMGPQARRAFSAAAQVGYAWAMTFGLMGLFRAVLSRERPWVRYVSDSSYWLYIAHLPLIICAQMIVRDWQMPAVVKFALVCVVVTGALLLIYHALVRYTWLGKLLNGPRQRPGKAGAAPSQAA